MWCRLTRTVLSRPALARRLSWYFLVLIGMALMPPYIKAQGGSTEDQSAAKDETDPTLLPHSQSARYWISAQDNIIFQYHPSFPAKYSGPNSLHAHAENATSNVGTLYLGYALSNTTEIFFDIESASGGGLSDALGLAGFTNLDVVRNPLLSVKPYIARGMVRQIIPLSNDSEEAERGPLALATRVPVRRLEFRAGKFGVVDFFDQNGVGSDSRLQFLNWTVDNNGAYDYAADTRGYTVGVLAEYHDRNWAFRFAEGLMPTVANGIQYQWNLRKARAENYELELHPRILGQHRTAVRLLGYENHANMGSYRQAVIDFVQGKTARPDITAHPLQTTVKYGFGVNLEQDFTHNWRAFARWGWNEGQHETFAYTEVDQTVALGADLAGEPWRRKLDKVGAAFVSSGISRDHQQYLALGGRGFLLGDGALNYGRENIFESYYNAHLWRGIYASVDLQHVNNPGYNRGRGPVWVPGARLHLEF
ncbi:MAG TPA: carbohydrate porin [Terriglobales bacterium]|nr:carbohydrate porin [Terriglobales bacterium]